jgi:hypothetical protein
MGIVGNVITTIRMGITRAGYLPYRRGAVRKGLTDDTTRHRRKGLRKHQHLACRLLYRLMKIGEALEYRCVMDLGGKVMIEEGIAAWSTFVRTQRAFLVVVATEQAIVLCKNREIEVPDVSGEVKRLVEVHSTPLEKNRDAREYQPSSPKEML